VSEDNNRSKGEEIAGWRKLMRRSLTFRKPFTKLIYWNE
jgi:hypothetical protein